MSESKAPRAIHAEGTRLYTACGAEVAVATKADPKWRHVAHETAAEMERRYNGFPALLAACQDVVWYLEDFARMADADGDTLNGGEMAEQAAKLRAAIEQARGEEE